MLEFLAIGCLEGELVALEGEELGTGSDAGVGIFALDEVPPFVSDNGGGEGEEVAGCPG